MRRVPGFVLPLLLLVIQVGGTYGMAHHPGPGPHGGTGLADARPLDGLALALVTAGPVLLTLRHRFPTVTFLSVTGVDLAYFCLGYPAGPIFLSLTAAFFLAVLTGPRMLAWVIAPLAYILIIWSDTIFGRGDGPSLTGGLGAVGFPLAILVTAELVRLIRERISRTRAEEQRIRQEEARRRAGEERMRIAQELHDVLAHNISLINVQASTALHLLDEQPEHARPSLAAIKEASKEALGELRSALDVLRRSGEQAPRAPTTGLADLDDLTRRTIAAGIAVTTVVDGDPYDLRPDVDLAAFRIVQEALTNIVRHSDAGSATVRIGYRPTDLTVEVTDDGTATPSPVPGNGLLGMRERVATLGGEIATGPRPGGGFGVRARLPIRT